MSQRIYIGLESRVEVEERRQLTDDVSDRIETLDVVLDNVESLNIIMTG
ncbi:MAG: hypothetical protein GY868_03090 [Deltaproteobacteria bacterium]|nr:hypothetical protein [Deltaproteobacteria bacterium]